MEGSRQVFVKVMLFQLRGHGHPQDDALPNFFPDSKSSISGLLNQVSFATENFWKDGENQKDIVRMPIFFFHDSSPNSESFFSQGIDIHS